MLMGSVLTMYTAEAKSKTGKINVGFGDARGFQGKAKIKIWNLDNDDKVIVKDKIDFSKLNPSAKCFCKTFSFKLGSNHVGDRIALQVITGGSFVSGNGWSDDSGQWKLKKGTTQASITLDEIGE